MYKQKKLKWKFTKLAFLKLPLPLDVYKEVLATLHQNVIPPMSNPAILWKLLRMMKLVDLRRLALTLFFCRLIESFIN